MTSLERYLAVCKGELPDRAPVSPFIMQFAAKVAGVSYRDYCLDGEVMAHAQMTCQRRFGYDSVNVTSDAVREYQALGGPVADFGEESVPAAEPEPFIKDLDDLKRLHVPDPLGDNPMRQQINALKILLHELPDQPVYAWIEAPFQESCILRDINYFMVDLRSDTTLPKEILKFAVELESEFAYAQIEAGAQFIGIGDAIASLGSADDYAEFNFPYLSELVNRIKARGAYIKYHACGRTKHIWQYIKQLNIDILNLDSLIDFGQAREFFGDKFVLKGNLNPIT
ncbi:MAG TPA: uroporphyrinogen decarboxylase family protein, partial [Anaerolineae bacterium]|nr:uroporphyrinogen decarboxylase family protein [Anaerolineae bacterium]